MKTERTPLRAVSNCSLGRALTPAQPTTHRRTRLLKACSPPYRPSTDDGSIHQWSAASSQPAVLIQQGDHISDSLGVGFAGVELVAELNTIASSLLLSSESRAFSFSICSISFSICSVSLLTRKDSFLSCSVSLSSCFVRSFEALICFSMSGLRRQLSVCNHKRHRDNDEPHAPLLLELEADACWEGDVVIGAEQGNQGNHEAGMGLDDSLAIKLRGALKRIRTLRQVWPRFDRRDDLRQDREPKGLDRSIGIPLSTRGNAPWRSPSKTRVQGVFRGCPKLRTVCTEPLQAPRSSGANPAALGRGGSAIAAPIDSTQDKLPSDP
jgi:hypothetical protein